MTLRIMAGLAALTVGAAALSGCTGHDAVDQTASGQFRYVQATPKGGVIAADERKPAGQVTGELLDGGTYRLSDAKGHDVVVNFWGSWCGPCQVETPAFDKLYRDVKSTGVQFVGMDVKETSRDNPKAFVRDNDISYPIVYDPNAKTALELGRIPQTGLPVTVIVDKQQRVAAVYLGEVQPQDVSNALARLQ